MEYSSMVKNNTILKTTYLKNVKCFNIKKKNYKHNKLNEKKHGLSGIMSKGIWYKSTFSSSF